MKPTKEELLEALAAFRNLYEKSEKKYNSQHMTVLQETFNLYLKLNKAYHGRYVSAKSKEFLNGDAS